MHFKLNVLGSKYRLSLCKLSSEMIIKAKCYLYCYCPLKLHIWVGLEKFPCLPCNHPYSIDLQFGIEERNWNWIFKFWFLSLPLNSYMMLSKSHIFARFKVHLLKKKKGVCIDGLQVSLELKALRFCAVWTCRWLAFKGCHSMCSLNRMLINFFDT